MIKLKKIVCILIFSIVFAINGNTAIKDSIFATVGDRAVTRSDIINEIKLILILNGQEYSEAIKEKLDNSAVQSVIKRTIKKIEIEKHGYLRFSQSELDEKLKHVAYNVDMTLDTLKQTLVTNGLEYSSIVDQIKTDLLWKSLIFSLYKERLSINVEEITDQLKTIDEKKEILLADEISPDTCRLWDVLSEKKLDKDRFRKDLGNIIQAYQEVARRLGIIHEESNISTVKFGKPKAVNIKKK